ncbi:rhomboid family intramembrane serine protease [Pantanalinema rosaneae CENA516]|uniref:rhomboid family intramembrane serine protease n=1 Tax=Pantanalinema rosaneae TaxID=1620701 RepID=UPI003D6DFC6A
MRSTKGERTIAGEIRNQFTILLGLVAVAWTLEIIDQFLLRSVSRTTLDVYGIVPQSLIGLRGILFAPFLHGNFAHLIGNTIPFVVLGWLVMLRETSDFFIVSIIAGLSSGLGTWLIGRPGTIHIGASGVIFGYLGYLLLRGFFERSVLAISLAIVTAVLYGSLVFGVLPFQYGISWEGHLFGFIGGIVAAWMLANERKRGG